MPEAPAGTTGDSRHGCRPSPRQFAHQFVKHLSGIALKGRIGFAAGAHATDHICAILIRFQETIHGIDVILQIRIDGDHTIASIRRQSHARPQCIHMARIVSQFYPFKPGILLVQRCNNFPGLVLTAIIYQYNTAFPIDYRSLHHIVGQFHQSRRRNGQRLFFIITGNDNVQNRSFHIQIRFTVPFFRF